MTYSSHCSRFKAERLMDHEGVQSIQTEKGERIVSTMKQDKTV